VAKAKQTNDPTVDIPHSGRQLARTTSALVVSPRDPGRAVIGLVAPAPPGLRARQLFQEAKRASLEHVGALQSAVTVVQALLDDVVEGGDVYAPGLSEFAARLGEELFWKSKTLGALAQKQGLWVGAPFAK
jgi:hypothetical protein